MDSSKPGAVTGRRQLLKGAVTGALVATTSGSVAVARTQAAKEPVKASPSPTSAVHELIPPTEAPEHFVSNPNSDVMVDVLKSLGIQYIAANPGSSFRGLHESIVNHGGNTAPELLTCLHEETSVAIAAGYARAAGRPMAAMMHSTVGIQHASMSIYHAYCDQAPILMFSGGSYDAATRRPNIEWIHSAQDEAATVREFTKWDDRPASIQHFAESAVRAIRVATTVPMGPVLISLDSDLQEEAFSPGNGFQIPRLTPSAPPIADGSALQRIAEALVAAESPLIVAHRYARTTAAMAQLVDLAMLLQAPVIDSGDRFNFPTDHPLNHSIRARALVAEADVILALEPVDLWGTLNRIIDQAGRPAYRVARKDAQVFTIGASDKIVKANYQNFQRYAEATLGVDGDAEASLPLLIEHVRRLTDAGASGRFQARGESLRALHKEARERDRQEARYAWEATPVSTARLCSEIWELVKGEDWVLASQTNSVSSWPQRLWDINKPHQYVGAIGAAGVGCGIGIATGVALAHRGSGKVVVNIQNDGDLLYAPGALWTAVHHRIPMLNVVHNNRAYHQEIMHIQRMANRRERGLNRAGIGCVITDPPIAIAKLASSMGMWSTGPIASPGDLRPALAKALKVVKRGEPALVEVLTQPR